MTFIKFFSKIASLMLFCLGFTAQIHAQALVKGPNFGAGQGLSIVNEVSGKIGIATTTPTYGLTANVSDFFLTNPANLGRNYRISTNASQQVVATNDLTTSTGGNKLFVVGTGSTNKSFMVASTTNNNIHFMVNGTNGNVGISNTLAIGSNVATPAGYRLYVHDGILTEKVKVAVKSTTDWADYVFADNYPLSKLADVEAFVKKNKHLPNFPSAQEMTTQGLDVAKMDAKLLEKIEELTLYLIGLNKEVQDLKAENNGLKTAIQSLKN